MNNQILSRIVPSGFKIIQLAISSSRIKTLKPLHKFAINMYYGVALAVLWPFKSQDNTKKMANGGNKIDISPVLIKADTLFENGYFEECYNFLTTSEAQDPKNVELLWRKCRVLYNMSKEPKYDENFKKQCVFEAYTINCELLKDHSNHFAVQKWFALLLDAKSTIVGIKERVKQLENVKKHMDLAVTINPNDATTLHMLGEWCFQVTELPWHQRKIAEAFFASPPTSTYEDALEYFLRAESAQPRFYSLNLLRLGTCYLKLNKEDQAKYYLKLAACYPAKSNDDHYANKEATELLKRYRLS